MALLSFGVFAWIQSVSGLVFGQLDRLVAGVVFGAAAVTAYSLCVQLSQPIYGVVAAGLHFLFPRISVQHALEDRTGVRWTVLLGACANLVVAVLGTSVVLAFGPAILRRWGGLGLASQCAALLPVIAWSTAFTALGVTGGYSMLALGRARTLTLFTLAGGVLMCTSMWALATRFGLQGMAWSRMIYGPVTCLVYFPLLMSLSDSPKAAVLSSLASQSYKEAQ
jgi:O-antigen/teichoic acid export membrane protein